MMFDGLYHGIHSHQAQHLGGFLFTFSKDPFCVDKVDETLLTLGIQIQTTGFWRYLGPIIPVKHPLSDLAYVGMKGCRPGQSCFWITPQKNPI